MPPRNRYLTNSMVKVIFSIIDQLFIKARYRFLGPQSLDKKIIFGLFTGNNKLTHEEEQFNLPNMYQRIATEERNSKPSMDELDRLIRIAGGYLDVEKQRTKVQVVKAVEDFINNAAKSGVKTDVETVLGGQLADVWGKVKNNIKTIVHTETNNTKNMSVLDSIVKVNSANAIEDPVVYWVCVHDDALCAVCKELHLMPDEITPRLWHMSELKSGYYKKGEKFPTLGNLHPNDRCTIATLLPGWGFNGSGTPEFKGFGFEAIKEQRGT